MIDKVIDNDTIIKGYIAANEGCGIDATKYLPYPGYMTVLLDIAINPPAIFIDDIACTNNTYAYVFRGFNCHEIIGGYISKPIPTDDGQDRTTIWSFNPDDFDEEDMILYDINDNIPQWYSLNFAKHVYGLDIGNTHLEMLTRTMISVLYNYMESNSSDDTIDLLCGHGHHFYSRMIDGHLSIDFHQKKPDKLEYYETTMCNIHNFQPCNQELVYDLFKLAKTGRLDNIIKKADYYAKE